MKYTFRFEEFVVASLIGSTAEEVEQRLGIAAETVERIVRNRIEDAKKPSWIDRQRRNRTFGDGDEISTHKGTKAMRPS